jgi:Ser/Thr protein kinase RdoA (MazF antagonist)
MLPAWWLWVYLFSFPPCRLTCYKNKQRQQETTSSVFEFTKKPLLLLHLFPRSVNLEHPMDPSSDEHRRKALKPRVTCEQVEAILRQDYALPNQQVRVLKELDSYDDVNFQVKIGDAMYLLKIHNGVESNEYLASIDNINDNNIHTDPSSAIHFQCAMMDLLNARQIPTYRPVAPLSPPTASALPLTVHTLPVVSSKDSPCRLVVRLLKWIAGVPMSQLAQVPLSGMALAGQFLGRMDHVLDEMNIDSNNNAIPEAVDSWHASGILRAARRFHQWDGQRALALRSFVSFIPNESRRAMVTSILDAFETNIIQSQVATQLRRGVLHADFNDANIIIQTDPWHVAGVIDFGDSVERYVPHAHTFMHE